MRCMVYPLQRLEERRDPSVEIVKNDISFGESGRVLILTGPNINDDRVPAAED